MNLLKNYTGSEIIWQLFPEFKTTFSNIYDKKKEEESSDILWALIHLVMPKVTMKNLSLEERKELILMNFKNKLPKSFDWSEYGEEIRMLEKMCFTKAKKFLAAWERKLEERENFMDSVPYTNETYEMLDKMMVSSDRIWNRYETILKTVQEEDELLSKGGAMLSLADSEQI